MCAALSREINAETQQREHIIRQALETVVGFYVNAAAFKESIKTASVDIVDHRVGWTTPKADQKSVENIQNTLIAYMDAFVGRGHSNEKLVTSLLRNPQILTYSQSKAQEVIDRINETTERLTSYKQFGIKENDVFDLYMNNSRFLTYIPRTIENQIVLEMTHLASPFVHLKTDADNRNTPALFQKNRLNLALNVPTSITETFVRMIECEFIPPQSYGGKPLNATTPYYVVPSDSYHSKRRTRRGVEAQIMTSLGIKPELLEVQTSKRGNPENKKQAFLIVSGLPTGKALEDEKRRTKKLMDSFIDARREHIKRQTGLWPVKPEVWHKDQSIVSLFSKDGSSGIPRTAEDRLYLASRLSMAGILSINLIPGHAPEHPSQASGPDLSTSSQPR